MSTPTEEMRASLATNGPGMLVPWYLIASYAYYVADSPVISDEDYDGLCKRLLLRWEEVSHPHKHLVDVEALRAGTAFHLTAASYPGIVVGAAHRLMAMVDYTPSGSRAKKKRPPAG
jgi:hypothetical protein